MNYAEENKTIIIDISEEKNACFFQQNIYFYVKKIKKYK